MAVRPILQDGDPILHDISIPVPAELFNTPELEQILNDMIDTLDREKDGVALAAPQIGISYRIFVVRYDRTVPSSETEGSPEPVAEIGIFINPQFTRSSRRRVEMDEGCLSVRGIFGSTLRHERATVRAQDVSGATVARGGGGLLAQIFQHETDHLNGILFVDHAIDLVDVTKRRDAAEELPEEGVEEHVP